MSTPSTEMEKGTVTPPQNSGAPSPLKSDRGATTIHDDVVAKVAGIATREVSGVYSMGGAVSRALGGVTQRMGGDGYAQGVHVEVGERQAAVDLTLVVEYGESIPRVADGVRANVTRRIEEITGLQVTEVNVSVKDLHIPGDDKDEETRVS